MRGTWHRLFVTKSYLRGFCNLAQNDLALCEVPKNQFGAFGKEVFHVPVQPHFHGLFHEGSLQKLLAEGLEQKLLALHDLETGANFCCMRRVIFERAKLHRLSHIEAYQTMQTTKRFWNAAVRCCVREKTRSYTIVLYTLVPSTPELRQSYSILLQHMILVYTTIYC